MEKVACALVVVVMAFLIVGGRYVPTEEKVHSPPPFFSLGGLGGVFPGFGRGFFPGFGHGFFPGLEGIPKV